MSNNQSYAKVAQMEPPKSIPSSIEKPLVVRKNTGIDQSPVDKNSNGNTIEVNKNSANISPATNKIYAQRRNSDVDVNVRSNESEREPGQRIPVRMHGHTYDQPSVNEEECFSGVKRRQTVRYYLSGINSNSTRQGIVTYLENRNVHVTYLKIFSKRDRQRFLTAKLNIDETCVNIINERNFWPTGACFLPRMV